jgi:O-antigen ligase
MNKKSKWLLYYQCALAVGAILICFTNLDTYMMYAVSGPSPKLWIIAFAVTSCPLLLSFSSIKKFFPVSLLVWLIGYLSISILYWGLGLPHQTAFEELKTRTLSVFFMLIMSLIFSQGSIPQTWARRTMLIVTFMNIFTYFYGVVNPSIFVTVTEHQSAELTGRPSGFYVDANRAGCALVTGLIFSFNLIQKKYVLPFMIIILTGILVTFSRSALIIWMIILALLLIKKEIPHSHLFTGTAVVGILWIVISLIGGSLLDISGLDYSDFLSTNAMDRLAQFESPFSSDAILDSSGQARLFIVELAWKKFLDLPFFGWGLGENLEIERMYEIRPHNMYLLFMVEHGFIGALFLPLLILAVTYNATRNNKTMSLAFAVLIMIWGLFSHNILEHREFLLVFSLMAAINTTSQQEQKYHQVMR